MTKALVFCAIVAGLIMGWAVARLDLNRMGVNPPLTGWVERLKVVAGRFITQTSAAWARAVARSQALAPRIAGAARALLLSLGDFMDRAQQYLMERAFKRQMTMRRWFLVDPKDTNAQFTPEGRLVLAHWARHAHALAPVQTSDPIQMAKAEGKRELFALILADIFDNLPDFARAMAAEEARQAEEILAA